MATKKLYKQWHDNPALRPVAHQVFRLVKHLGGEKRAAPLLAVGAFVAGFTLWTWITLPTTAAVILTAASLLSLAAWSVTGLSRPVRSRKVVALYLAAVAFQFLHLAEEWTGDFPHELVMLTGSDRSWEMDQFLWMFVFICGALWIAGGAAALMGSRVGNWFLWMYALGAGFINAIAHFIFPVVHGGYFPGLLTAPGHLVLSVLLIYALVREDRRLRDTTSPAWNGTQINSRVSRIP